MESEDDRKLWADVVAAEKQLVQARFQFNERSHARKEQLREALEGASKSDRRAALAFLEVFPEDVPDLLDRLFDISLSPGWALATRRAIARGPAELVTPALRQLVERQLADPETDADDYRRIAELLDHVNHADTLAHLANTANQSADPEIREVGTDYTTP
jgi:hypothetical protein